VETESTTRQETTRPGELARIPLLELLRPKSVAVIGASSDTQRLGWRPIKFLLDSKFTGQIYPVNPAYESVGGLKCYGNLQDLPEVPDAIVVLVAADLAVEAVRTAAGMGVKLAVVLSSGFAEVGEQGISTAALLQAAGPMRLVGPNIPGIANLVDGIPLGMNSFLYQQPWVSGSIGLVTQSGGIASPMLNRAFDRHIGFSYILAVGNQVDVDVVESISALTDDSSTRVIACIMETVRDGQKFTAALGRARDLGKPVLVLKLGRSVRGAELAVSHTASIVGDSAMYDAIFDAENAIRVEEPDDLFELGSLFARYTPPKSVNAAVLSVSGGGAELLADMAEKHGVSLPNLSGETVKLVQSILGSYTASSNPLDMTGYVFHNPDALRAILRQYVADPSCDVVVVGAYMNTPHIMSILVDEVIAIAATAAKPIVVISGSGELNREPHDRLFRAGVPTFFRADLGLRAVGEFCRYGMRRHERAAWPDRPGEHGQSGEGKGGAAVPLPVTASADGRLTEHQAKEFLRACGLAVPPGVAVGASAWGQRLDQLRFPLVAKANSAKIAHKSELGAVRLDIGDKADLSRVVTELVGIVAQIDPDADAQSDVVLVEEQVTPGHEAVVAVRADERLGVFLTVGAGGTEVELHRSDAFAMRPCPVDHVTAREMINATPLGQRLAGYRGRPGGDAEKLAAFMVDLSRIGAALGRHLVEIECNPVIVNDHEAVAADVVMTLAPNHEPGESAA
jgi:acyl-CoA synthetase (NDP forming)